MILWSPPYSGFRKAANSGQGGDHRFFWGYQVYKNLTILSAESCRGGHMKRRLAREIAVSSLYQMEMNEVSAAEAVDMLMEELRQEKEIGADPSEVGSTDEFAREIVSGVMEHRQAIDGMLQQFLTGWHIDRLSRVDRQVLRLA